MSPPQVNNYTIKVLKDSEVGKISNNELKTTMIKVINDIKEDMYKLLNEFKEYTNKQQNQLKENSNIQICEIKNRMQDIKEKFNKHIEILKKIKLKFWK